MTPQEQQELMKNLTKVGEQSAEMINEFMKNAEMAEFKGLKTVTDSMLHLADQMVKQPEKLIQAQLDLYQSYLGLWATMAERMMGQEVNIEPTSDKRFKHEAWQENIVFDYIKQSYLLASKWFSNTVDTLDIDPTFKPQIDFYTQQFVDALSPTNFPMTNPEVLQATLDSKGENLIQGFKNLMKDIDPKTGVLNVQTVDKTAFKPGENIATTEGSVVFETPLIQLIQYTPKTEKVAKRPLLICPPWINKFYILDLQAKNSLVKYLVEEAEQTVFMISWKNPDESYKEFGWEEYMEKGLLAAIDEVLNITGEKSLNAVGYCIGGTLLMSTLAYLKAKKDSRVNAASFLTTLTDFEGAGDLGVFLDENQVSALEAKMNKVGYLDGAEMARTFAMLRANDMIWSFVINNYMLGKEPFPFDLLYWNADNTRMPAKMHSFYLRNMYLENNLVQKDKMTLLGEKIDISRIDIPVYMISTKDDHITPWETCFKPLNKLSGDVTFVLGNSGHVAGVVNPPAKQKGYHYKKKVEQEKPHVWLEKAKKVEGSWWTDWNNWLNEQSPKTKVAARKIKKEIMPAPGSYVQE